MSSTEFDSEMSDFIDLFGIPLIFDFGTHSTKFGLLNWNKPIVQPSYLGIERVDEKTENTKSTDPEVSSDSQPWMKKKIKDVRYHIDESSMFEKCDKVAKLFSLRGFPNNYHHFETFVDEIVSNNREKLGVNRFSNDKDFFRNTCVGFIEASLTPKNNREKMVSIFFETYDLPAFYIMLSPTNNLFFYQSTQEENKASVVVDIGREQTRVNAVFEGYMLPHRCYTCPYGGDELTNEFLPLFANDFTEKQHTNFLPQIVIDRLIKPKYTYFSLNHNFDTFCASGGYSCLFDLYKHMFHIFPVEIIHMIHQFAYGNHPFYKEKLFSNPIIPRTLDKLQVFKSEQFDGAELLFNATKEMTERRGGYKFGGKGIIECVEKLINDLNGEINDVDGFSVENVLFCGGGSVVRNFKERVEYEIDQKLKKDGPNCVFEGVKLGFHEDRQFASWLGAQKLMRRPQIIQQESRNFFTKEMYDDAGATLIHRKGFF